MYMMMDLVVLFVDVCIEDFVLVERMIEFVECDELFVILLFMLVIAFVRRSAFLV